MTPIAFWILVIDLAVMAGALASMAIQVKRGLCAWVSNVLDGCAVETR